jgi:hypothetical protein
MATDITTFLARQITGGKDSLSKEERNALPDSLKKLVDAIDESNLIRANTNKKELDAAENRKNEMAGLERQFLVDLKEAARAFNALNETEARSLKLAEKEAKDGEAARRRADAAAKRAENLNAVSGRQSGELQKNWLGLIGAIGGKGFQGLVENFVKASEQTKTDIAAVSTARYENMVGEASDIRAETVSGIDKGVDDADAALARAQKKYAASMEKAAELSGRALQKVEVGNAALTQVETAKAALDTAKENRDAVAAAGAAKLQEARKTATPAGLNGATGIQSITAALGAVISPIGDIASAIREAPAASAGLILDAGTQAAVQAEKMAKVEAEVASKNLEADAAVSKAGDAYAKLVTPKTDAEGKTRPSVETSGLITYSEGIGAAYNAAEIRKGAVADLTAAEDANKAARAEATASKAAAIREEEKTVSEAFAQKQEGSLVTASQQKDIGFSNLMNMAVAPPAVIAIGKVMDKFKDMFPVFEQTGGALIEMATAIPAVGITLGNELAAKLIFMGSQISDAIRLTSNPLRERYEESNTRVAEATGKTRAEWFSEYQGARVEEERQRAKTTTLASSADRGSVATLRSPVRANAPATFSVETIPGTSGGITHQAPTSTAAKSSRVESPAPAPAYPREQSVGVVPVGASNSNVDMWR